MPKIAIIGAGGFVFPLRLIGDLLSFPELRDSTLALMDIDEGRVARTADAARELVAHYGFPARVEATTDRRRALDGADFVIVTFYIGDGEMSRLDKDIPLRYGIDQPVGDTLGPGGVMRFLRAAATHRALAADIRELCPRAQLINYANPMAMVCWYLNHQGVTPVGLCHSVQNTSRMLAHQLDVPYEEVRYRVAGINHQAWFLEFRRGDEDLYPRLRAVLGTRFGANASEQGATRDASAYEGAQEWVRTAIMEGFGYFHTESSHHASEYLPYFRKDAATIASYIPERWPAPGRVRDVEARTRELLAAFKERLEPSHEYGAFIVHSMTTGEPRVIYGNVENRGLIPNLPEGCCVEVPCLVDRNGVQPTVAGPLPPQCAAVNRTNVNVQELAVQAALTGEREHIYHAIMLDPLTGALLTLPQIRRMVDELIAAEAAWLPQFAARGLVAAG